MIISRSSLRRCFLVVHDEAEPAWQIDVMLLADGETSVCCLCYVHTGCQSQTKWQLGWVMVVLDLCNIFDKISGE